MRLLRTIAVSFACAAVLASTSAQAQTANPYAPYEFLIGDWDTGDSIRQSFSWGPEHAYIRYSTTTRGRDGADHLHFDGIMVYNAANRNLDFLVALEPGSLAQEQGTLHVEADGSIVRDATLTGANGAQSHFRQTFRSTGAASAVTSLMRQNASGGWAPTFPGSDNLAMARRAS